MKIIGIIPARWESKRFPGKPLVEIDGIPMVVRVYRQALLCPELDKIIIATDSELIADTAIQYGCEVVITSQNPRNGTERCWEAFQNIEEDYDAVINIQGDEPFIQPEQISLVASLLIHEAPIATLAKKIDMLEDIENPNVVKVVFNKEEKALYFSRLPIPYSTDAAAPYYKHIGIYGFDAQILGHIVQLPVCKLETRESLEQLRWLYNDIAVKIAITELESIAVDTPEDLLKL